MASEIYEIQMIDDTQILHRCWEACKLFSQPATSVRCG